ncbi:GNAT family N-acetyltransferase [Ciceribacter thiooxidans]|nr:GNAT family N-acetyltransferase [Ciceribacter thiooxidans]
MNKAVLWAEAEGLNTIRLETQTNSVAACRFYQDVGFMLGGYDRYLYCRMDPDDAHVVDNFAKNAALAIPLKHILEESHAAFAVYWFRPVLLHQLVCDDVRGSRAVFRSDRVCDLQCIWHAARRRCVAVL